MKNVQKAETDRGTIRSGRPTGLTILCVDTRQLAGTYIADAHGHAGRSTEARSAVFFFFNFAYYLLSNTRHTHASRRSRTL